MKKMFRAVTFFRARSPAGWWLLLVLLPHFLSACAPYAPPPRSGLEEIAVPEQFSLQEAMQEPGQRWWETFGDEQLNRFMAEALTGNQDLLSFWARLEKARAQALKAGAGLSPALNADAGVSYAETERGGNSAENTNFSAGLAASYEVDLWGRVRAGHESALLAAAASREDLNSAAMSVAAEVAERWLAILARRLEKRLLEQQLETNKIYLELVELRFRKSLASALDVFQQRQLVERVTAQLPLVEMQERLQENQLALLLGRMPGAAPRIERHKLPVLETVPAAGLPAQLLQNRPDIAAALRRLEAADQDLAAARADRLPALRLAASGGYESDELESLFDNWIASLAASLALPIVDGSRRRAEVAVNRAAVQEQLAEYRQVVLSAVREVEDALLRETKTRQHIAALEKQLQASNSALTEARTRYVNGLNDYLPVLTQLLSVQNLESDLIRRQEELLGTRVSLYRAIGGAWVDDLAPPARNK